MEKANNDIDALKARPRSARVLTHTSRLCNAPVQRFLPPLLASQEQFGANQKHLQILQSVGADTRKEQQALQRVLTLLACLMVYFLVVF